MGAASHHRWVLSQHLLVGLVWLQGDLGRHNPAPWSPAPVSACWDAPSCGAEPPSWCPLSPAPPWEVPRGILAAPGGSREGELGGGRCRSPRSTASGTHPDPPGRRHEELRLQVGPAPCFYGVRGPDPRTLSGCWLAARSRFPPLGSCQADGPGLVCRLAASRPSGAVWGRGGGGGQGGGGGSSSLSRDQLCLQTH